MTRKTVTPPKADQPQDVDQTAASGEATTPDAAPGPGKLDCLEALLRRDGGASLAEMVAATNWQTHSIRGAMAGALKKRGLAISSQKLEGVRRYQGAAA